MSVTLLASKIVGLLRSDFGEQIDGLRPPISSRNRAFLENNIKVGVPGEMLELLTWHDGEEHAAITHMLSPHCGLLPSRQIVADYNELTKLASCDERLDIEDPDSMGSVGAVRPYKWSVSWIPFWRYDVPWALDMSPASGGTVGQVISVDWEGMVVRVEFTSLNEMFEHYFWSLANGSRDFIEILKE